MNKKQALKALIMLVNLISDKKLRSMIRSALDLMIKAIEEEFISAVELRAENERLTGELNAEKREHQDHHERETSLLAANAAINAEVGRQLDEIRRLKAEIAQTKAAQSVADGFSRKVKLRATEEATKNKISAIKDLRMLLNMGLADAKTTAEIAFYGDGTTTVVLSATTPIVCTEWWQEVV